MLLVCRSNHYRMKRLCPCIQQSMLKFVLPAFSCTERVEEQEQDTLMRFASLKIAEGHQDGQRAGEHDVWEGRRARSAQLERKTTALLASIDVMKPNNSWVRGNPHELNHEKFWLDIKLLFSEHIRDVTHCRDMKRLQNLHPWRYSKPTRSSLGKLLSMIRSSARLD